MNTIRHSGFWFCLGIYFLWSTSCSPPGEIRDRERRITDSQEVMSVAPRIGALAPPFSLKTLDGNVLSLSDFKGKPVLLNFWATWCPPCRDEMPLLQRGHEVYREKGLVMVGINSGETQGVVDRYVDQSSLTFPVVLDRSTKVSDAYNVMGLPVTFLIDKGGVIRGIMPGAFPSFQRLSDALDSIMVTGNY